MSNPKETIQAVQELIRNVKIAMMCTVDGDKPRVRPMAMFPISESEIWAATFKSSRKVQQINSNPGMELCFMDQKMNHVRLTGSAVVSDNGEARKKMWEAVPDLADHFKSVDDPEFVVVQFKAQTLEYLPYGTETPEVMQL